MKVKNISKQRYCHSRLDENYKLEILTVEPNEIKEVPNEVAENWISSGGVIQFVEPKEAKKLADENEALKKELEKLKNTNSTTKTTYKKKKTTKKTK